MTILDIKNIKLHFRQCEFPALQNINYQIMPGDFVILLGGNGSGKSTLLKLLHRHHQPDQGEINFLNKPIRTYSPMQFAKEVSILTQDCSESLFASLTLFENYLLIKKFRKMKSKGDSLSAERNFLANYLKEFNPNLANKLDNTVGQFSGGEKQALALAFFLLQPPSLLLLDEHTSALDPKSSEQIMQLTQKIISEHHITCVLTTHDLDIALRFGNRILMLREGKIYKTFDQEEKQLLTKEMLVANYF